MTSTTTPPRHLDDEPAGRAGLTLAVAALATLATFLDTTILFVAFPDIGASFDGADASTLSWVLNAYTIVFAALLGPAGKLADRVGHRRALGWSERKQAPSRALRQAPASSNGRRWIFRPRLLPTRSWCAAAA